MNIPALTPIRQTAPQPIVTDVVAEVRRQWLGSRFARRLQRGAKVGVAVGSRGIANLFPIVRTTLDCLRELGAEPFVVAAMGSHGGATAEGQRELLAEYGVSEARLGVAVKTDMTTAQIGTNSWGEPVFWDKNALAADAVVTLSRVKPHTDFRGQYESGICKMIVIGLGKRDGASQHHRWGVRGLRDMLPETAKIVLDKTPFAAGLAILENANEQTARLQVVDRDEVLAVEPGLLEEARRLMGRLPFDQLDLLVIGEIGKNYSGAGIDPVPFRMNNLTACFLRRSQLPFAFPTDRDCLHCAIETCWQPNVEQIRLAIIPNTLEVAELWVSASLVAEAKKNPHLEVTGATQAVPFDAAGNIVQERLFPHSVRGRRKQVRVA